MQGIHTTLSELVGRTPLFLPERFISARGLDARLLIKLEFFNPGGSVKDRVALNMIEDAQARGVLTPGATIIEPTSGNTGIGLAAIGASRGYRVIITMPDSMSRERISLMRSYGAEVVLTPGAEGLRGAINKAGELAEGIPGSFIPGQFENPANPAAHYSSTGPEIWEDTGGEVDVFISGIGTGGTISGIGRYLLEKNPCVRVIGFEPVGSPFLTTGKTGTHGLQGIGAGFRPETFDSEICDEILTINEADAYAAARELAATEGLLCGITSGAALHAAAVVCARPEFKGKTVVTLMPDTGERYLSTALYSDL